MNKQENAFWERIRKITVLDDHVEAPAASVASALLMFNAADFQKESRSWIFGLRPAFTGAIRKAGSPQKEFYDLEDKFVVQLEKTRDEMGCHISGFAHGLEKSTVFLYGQECVFETQIDTGSFEFNGVPMGTYHLSFSHEGEELWIRNVVLNS